MKKLITICFLIVGSQVLSQNNAIISLQQRLVQAKGTEKIPELNNFAKTYRNIDPGKSIALGRKALKNINNDDITKVFSLINVGILYSEAGMGKESIPYYNDALDLLNYQKSDYAKYIRIYIYACLGESYVNTGDYKQALSYLRPALNNQRIFTANDVAKVFNNAGRAYLFVDSLKLAKHYINKAVLMFDSLNIDKGEIASLNSLATLLIRKHEFAKLPNIINKITILLTKEKDSYVAMNSYSLLSEYYAKKGDYKKSNQYLKKWAAANDSILNKNNRDALDKLQIKYETEKKDQEIKIQEATIKNKNLKLRYTMAGASGIFLVLIIISFLYRKRNEAYKQLVLQSLNGVGKNQYENEVSNYHNTIDKELKQQIMNAIEEQMESKVYLESGLAIKELAEKCDTNRSYLSQIIHEKYEMNFNNFINKYRIEEAKRLLIEPRNIIPLKALHERLGFSSYTRFHEAFKKYTGVTPTFFLKTIKEL